MTAASQPRSTNASLVILGLLALVMAATRINHFAVFPDASWAVFFVAGFYLNRWMRWAFPLLLVEAVLVDYFVISSQGLSFWNHYCVSAAYWFLIPAYFGLWFGGTWLDRHFAGISLRSAGLLAASALVAVSVCFVISNGSFYWLSANVPTRSFAGWLTNMGDWYFAYLLTTCAFIGEAALIHVLVMTARRSRAAAGVAKR